MNETKVFVDSDRRLYVLSGVPLPEDWPYYDAVAVMTKRGVYQIGWKKDGSKVKAVRVSA